VAAISDILEVLRYSGPVALADLQSRMGLALPDLLGELATLTSEGIVVLKGPLANLPQPTVPMTDQAAAETVVELSSRGLKSIMAR
jgi:hypothetical protein